MKCLLLQTQHVNYGPTITSIFILSLKARQQFCGTASCSGLKWNFMVLLQLEALHYSGRHGELRGRYLTINGNSY